MENKVTLDDSSYELIYEKAMKRVREQAPWWTHREVSDPGITLLEMWALLTDMQSYYLDQLQESHYRKYIQLLGQEPDTGETARVWITFNGVTQSDILPRGTKLSADGILFELAEETRLFDNEIVGVYRNLEKNLLRAMYMSRKNQFTLTNGQSLFSFALRKAPDKEICFFVLLGEKNKRNPAGRDFCMAGLVWEYRSGEGWREAELMRDETCGLLYSGLVYLKWEKEIVCTEGIGYEIRCRITDGEYDVMPVIYRICLNVAEAVQQNTLCCREESRLSQGEHIIPMETYLGQTGELTVLREKGEGLWEDITMSCEIEPPITAQRRKRRICLPQTEKGGLFRVVCNVSDLREKLPPIPVTGVTSQKIVFPWDNVKRDSVKLLLRKGSGSGVYEDYSNADPEACLEKAWHWEEEESAILLGDGRHGEIPEKAEEGVLFASLAVWEGDEGNVSIGRVKAWENPELFPGIVPVNLIAAAGGRKRQMPSEQFDLLRSLFLRQNRMVTQEDIRMLALETPGLLLRDAKAVWDAGKIRVTIYPLYPLRTLYCREKYRKTVEDYLAQFRLVGTCVRAEVEEEEEE